MIYIVLSTYNGSLYVHQQLDSILTQSIKNFILIIRDDGATDATP
jgi:rhamnosyltransferase